MVLENLSSNTTDTKINKSERNCFNFSNRNVTKVGNIRSPGTTVPHIKNFRSSKKRRQPSFSHRPNPPELLHKLPLICNDESQHGKTNHRPTILDGIPRPQGRIPSHLNEIEPAQIPNPFMPPKTLLLQNSSVWPNHSTNGFHVHNETPTGTTARKGSPCHCLFGRFVNLGGLSRDGSKFGRYGYNLPDGSRFLAELAEIGPNPIENTDLVRDSMEFREGQCNCPSNIYLSNQESRRTSIKPSQNHPTHVRMPDRQNKLCFPDLTPGTPTISPNIQTTTDIGKRTGQVNRKNTPTTIESTPTMEQPILPSTTISNTTPVTITNSMDRCVNQGLGVLHLHRPIILGPVESRSGITPHQPVRATCSGPNYATLASETLSINNVRQHNNCSSNQQNRFQEPINSEIRSPPIPPSLEEKSMFDSSTHSRHTKRCSRLPVKRHDNRIRVGIIPGELQPNRRSNRISRSRSICVSNKPQTTDVRCPLCTSKGHSNRCLHLGLEPIQENISVPPTQRYSKSNLEATILQRSRSVHNTVQTNSAMVPISIEERPTITNSSKSPPNSPENDSVSLTTALRSMDRLSFLRMSYSKIYPPDVVDALLSSYRVSSNRQFESGWRAFKSWLPSDITIITKPVFLSFLVSLKNMSHNTALSYRNSLKLPLDIAFNISTSDKEFDLLAKSHFLVNPPKQKIVPSWNLDEAMINLEKKGSLKDLPKEESFMAALFVIAVATGNRASELANLDRTAIQFSPDNTSVTLTVLPSFIYKNQTASRTPPNIRIPALTDQSISSLCPVAAIRFLLESFPSEKHNLFCNPQTKAVLTSSTLRFWLCKSINWLLPNTIPRAHDVRKNAHSMAWVRGVPLSDILKQGFWSSSSVFLRKYLINKPEHSSSTFVAAGSTR